VAAGRGIPDPLLGGSPSPGGGLGRREHRSGRDLKTARAVLRVLRLLEQRGELEVGETSELLGKSHATAAYLLNSLVAEHFAERDDSGGKAHYRIRSDRPSCAPPPRPVGSLPAELTEALRELYERTGERSYLAALEDDAIVVANVLGRQGLPTIPGLGTRIQAEAHCLAVGKVILADLGLAEWQARIGGLGFSAFTPASPIDPLLLEAELAGVRAAGWAVDREEFVEAICCVAAPVRDQSGRLVAALGVSVSARRFPAVRAHLIESVRTVAAGALRDPPPPAPTIHRVP